MTEEELQKQLIKLIGQACREFAAVELRAAAADWWCSSDTDTEVVDRQVLLDRAAELDAES